MAEVANAGAENSGAANDGAPGAPNTPATENSSTGWMSHLSEDLRADPSIKEYKDSPEGLNNLAKTLIHAQKLVGMDKNQLLTVPGEDAAEDVWNEFYSKLGRPSEAKEYQLPVDEKVFNDTFQRSEEMENWFKTAAHKNGLSVKQVKGMYGDYMQFAKSVFDAGNQSLAKLRDEGISSIKKEWGAAYETKLGRAVSVLKSYADEEFVSMLDTTGLGSHPAMIRMLEKVAGVLGEDNVQDKSKASEMAMTPSEATAAIAQKHNDPQFMKAYLDGKHASHKWAVDEMSKLFKYQTAGSR